MNDRCMDDPYGFRERPGVYDTGTGAIKTVESNPGIPGIEKFKKTGFLKESADAATLADRVFVDLHLNW